jgi:hypothetical protein
MNIKIVKWGNGPSIPFYYLNHNQNQIQSLTATRIGIGPIFFSKKWFYSSNLRLGIIGFSLWLWVLGCVFGFSYFYFSCKLTIVLW